MVYEVIMPALGMAQDTGLLVGWMKSVGDAVAADDVLMEVETDKSVMEVAAGADGFIAELLAEVGQDVPVGQVIALISAEAPDVSTTPAPVAKPQAAASKPQPAVAEPIVPVAAPVASVPAVPQAEGGRLLASPKARRLAAEAGLDLSRLAEAGVAQPFHAADVDTLRNLPARAGVPDMSYAPVTSHIGAEVPIEAMTAFLARMRDEGRVELTLPQVVIAFAAMGLRRATKAESLALAATGAGQDRQIFHDPDRLRLSAVLGQASDAPAQLEVRDAGAGYLTTITLGGQSQPVLSVVTNDQKLCLTLGFSETQLGPDQAIEMMHDLTTRLADPMLALV